MYEHAEELAESLEELAGKVDRHPDVKRTDEEPVLTHEGHGEITVYCSLPDTVSELAKLVDEQVTEYDVSKTSAVTVGVTITEGLAGKRTVDTLENLRRLIAALRDHTDIDVVQFDPLLNATAGVTFRVFSPELDSATEIEELVDEYADEYEVLYETSMTRGRFHITKGLVPEGDGSD